MRSYSFTSLTRALTGGAFAAITHPVRAIKCMARAQDLGINFGHAAWGPIYHFIYGLYTHAWTSPTSTAFVLGGTYVASFFAVNSLRARLMGVPFFSRGVVPPEDLFPFMGGNRATRLFNKAVSGDVEAQAELAHNLMCVCQNKHGSALSKHLLDAVYADRERTFVYDEPVRSGRNARIRGALLDEVRAGLETYARNKDPAALEGLAVIFVTHAALKGHPLARVAHRALEKDYLGLQDQGAFPLTFGPGGKTAAPAAG